MAKSNELSNNHASCDKEKIRRALGRINSSIFFQRLKRYYKIQLFPSVDGIIANIELRDRQGDLVDTQTIQASIEGCLTLEQALEHIFLAHEMALEDQILKAASKRIREEWKKGGP